MLVRIFLVSEELAVLVDDGSEIHLLSVRDEVREHVLTSEDDAVVHLVLLGLRVENSLPEPVHLLLHTVEPFHVVHVREEVDLVLVEAVVVGVRVDLNDDRLAMNELDGLLDHVHVVDWTTVDLSVALKIETGNCRAVRMFEVGLELFHDGLFASESCTAVVYSQLHL